MSRTERSDDEPRIFPELKKIRRIRIWLSERAGGEYVGRTEKEEGVIKEGIRETPSGSTVIVFDSNGHGSLALALHSHSRIFPGSRVYGQSRNRTGGPRLLSLPA